jgi:hypothetical protein
MFCQELATLTGSQKTKLGAFAPVSTSWSPVSGVYLAPDAGAGEHPVLGEV